MFKTLRSKLLFGTIISVVVINIIFTIFIALFLENTLRTDIIKEITNIKSFSINTINQNELIGESKGKSLNSIKGLICWYGAIDYFATIEAEGFFSEEHKNIAEENGYFEVKSKRTGKVFKLGLPLYKEVYSIVPYKKLINVELPILFVHGLIDNMVPYDLSVKVSKLCKNSKLELIENGTHTFDNNMNALNKAIDVSIEFVQSILR